MAIEPVEIKIYRWAGQFGPFKIKIPCGECALTEDIVEDVVKTELTGIPVDIKIYDWLSYWWQPFWKGGWHAPIVLVAGKLVSQGVALNRGLLTESVITQYAQQHSLSGSHMYGKAGCPHCERAKDYLKQVDIDYEYHDVIQEPRDLYDMLARVKPLIGHKTPITVPQIWLEGKYVGGADHLKEYLEL